MAAQPRVKKTPRQQAAGQAFAAGGRRAQAAKRAQSIKKTGKPPPLTRKQRQADLRNLARARMAAARKRAGGTAQTPKRRAAPAPDGTLVLPGSSWPMGCNDAAPTCAAVAVGCCLQAATGLAVTDAEILKLHKMAGGDNGATIESTLEAARAHWGVFGHGKMRLMSFFRADESLIIAGMVVGVTLGHQGHAVLATPGGMISWGREMAWDGEPEECWCLEWGV